MILDLDLDLDSLLVLDSDRVLDLVRLAGDLDLYDLDLERVADFLARFRLESSRLVDLERERRIGEYVGEPLSLRRVLDTDLDRLFDQKGLATRHSKNPKILNPSRFNRCSLRVMVASAPSKVSAKGTV
ncbi:hypothetical protein BpHYR1_045436 [Brachionus plicatilis]|uniref:Uncharacterized protein n=1 Tax=Brachionus plicatilis TaxID=10195 RepID=A0A3M7PK57_BRAPC|nr:hypothetical protein BpHYR1_045436 [Brachionus plicatilis]